VKDVPPLRSGGILRIGIAAGASTPHNIIKEICHYMENYTHDEDFDFEKALSESFKRLHTGDRVKGIVSSVNSKEVIVDLGTKQTGYIPASEINTGGKKLHEFLRSGEEIETIVTNIHEFEGTVALSLKRANEPDGFDMLAKAKEDKTVLSGTVTSIVNGGIIVMPNRETRIFIPASHTGLGKEDDLNTLYKTKVKFVIISIDTQRRRAVGSIKKASSSKDELKLWDNIQEGGIYKGKVKSFTDYAAFVNIGGIDGMVHKSELSYSKISHPSEVLNIGDEVEVYVKKCDKEKRKLSLGYKRDGENPWVDFEKNYKTGDRVEVKIVSIAPFGAFARIVDGIDGLIHISRISEERVSNVSDYLKVGDVVKAYITGIDSATRRINLSIRTPKPEKADVENERETAAAE